MEFRNAQQFRAAYPQGKTMLENPKQREDGLRHLLLVQEHLEVTKDEKGAWWLANRIGGQTVGLIYIKSLAEAMDVSKRLITKQQELKKELRERHNEAYAGRPEAEEKREAGACQAERTDA